MSYLYQVLKKLELVNFNDLSPEVNIVRQFEEKHLQSNSTLVKEYSNFTYGLKRDFVTTLWCKKNNELLATLYHDEISTTLNPEHIKINFTDITLDNQEGADILKYEVLPNLFQQLFEYKVNQNITTP